MSPRLEPPRRRWFWGLVLALYLSASGWTSAAKLFKGLEYQQGQVRFELRFQTEDRYSKALVSETLLTSATEEKQIIFSE